MEDLFGALALLVGLASFPCGFLLARRCTENVFGRIALTLVFGIVFLIAGLIAVMAGCSGLGGKMDMR
jgi:drug/metabolite transporter (DMT)-like permease